MFTYFTSSGRAQKLCKSVGGHPGPGLPSLISHTVSVDINHHVYLLYVLWQSSGAVWKLRWSSWPWAPIPNKPYGFCGRNTTLQPTSSVTVPNMLLASEDIKQKQNEQTSSAVLWWPCAVERAWFNYELFFKLFDCQILHVNNNR